MTIDGNDKNQWEKFIGKIGQQNSISALKEMLRIRYFENKGEYAYQMGNVKGFYHSYLGQEAIQTGAVFAISGKENLWATSYRCHALAILLGMSLKEGMCELYGKVNGNTKGRGGSMHFYTDRMFGGSGIVGGQFPLSIGLAFGLKYKKIKKSVCICFGGDGSATQGSLHESLNLAALWSLPLILVVENNQFGMGTQVERSWANLPIGENLGKAYGLNSYKVNGMSFPDCYNLFLNAYQDVLTNGKPVIVEAFTNRFRGHSISDSGAYRTKEELEEVKKEDPIETFKSLLYKYNHFSKEGFETMVAEVKKEINEAMQFAEDSLYPDIGSLEEDVYV